MLTSLVKLRSSAICRSNKRQKLRPVRPVKIQRRTVIKEQIFTPEQDADLKEKTGANPREIERKTIDNMIRNLKAKTLTESADETDMAQILTFLMGYHRPTYAEIDLDAIEHNIKALKSAFGRPHSAMAIVKVSFTHLQPCLSFLG